MVEHYINLKPNCKPVAQKLRRLSVVQQEALFTEVKKLLQASFIYPMEALKWVFLVVVTPKKNGKWSMSGVMGSFAAPGSTSIQGR